MKNGTMPTLIGLLVLAGVIFVLNQVALEYFLYWRFWWYDVMMHFLGGVLVGGGAVWTALRFWKALAPRKLLMIALGALVVVGVGWEVFEYVSGAFAGEVGIIADTIQDLIMDTLGAIVAWWVVVRTARASLETNNL